MLENWFLEKEIGLEEETKELEIKDGQEGGGGNGDKNVVELGNLVEESKKNALSWVGFWLDLGKKIY